MSVRRMSVRTSVNGADVAVLAQTAYLPWGIVKPLYERPIEFNYLEEELLLNNSETIDGKIRIAGQQYKAILDEEGSRFWKGSVQQGFRNYPAGRSGRRTDWSSRRSARDRATACCRR
ncbi:hypothetical protein [Paenibacillus sp. MY03]|uniref:hypothetical protein n=1 Tax=Paenibacillus sp. MY03 TaxID=302980 RepID=UPI00117FE93B|nr:hypothetical protein [Paenibacillus sp. MY03]